MASPPNKPMEDLGLPLRKEDNTIHHTTSEGQGDVVSPTVKTLDNNVVDDAAKYLANTRDSQYPPMTPEREKKLKKKIDSWMIPLVRAYCCERRRLCETM